MMLYLLDVNLLIALTNPSHLHHQRAHAWFSTITSWATTSMTEASFLRLMLHPHVAGRSIPTAEVMSVLHGLRALPGHFFLPDDSTLANPVIDITALMAHNQVTDMHLVNLAAQHGGVLATFDAGIPATLALADRQFVAVI